MALRAALFSTAIAVSACAAPFHETLDAELADEPRAAAGTPLATASPAASTPAEDSTTTSQSATPARPDEQDGKTDARIVESTTEHADTVKPAAAEAPASPSSHKAGGLADVTPAPELTVEATMQYALDHHPLLEARRYEVAVAEADLVTAGLLPNPDFVMDTQSPVKEGGPSEISTRLTFTFPTAGKRRRAEAVARAGIQRVRGALNAEVELVLAEAADAAVEVLYLQELADLQAQLSGLSAEESKIQEARFTAGAIPLADRLEADVAAASVELDRLDTAALLEVARLRLSRAIGMPPTQAPRMAGQLKVEPVANVPLDTVLAAAVARRPELAEARAAVTESERALLLARAEAKPDFEFGPRYQDTLGSADDKIGVRFRTAVPLFDRNQGNICQSSAQIGANRALFRVAELTTLNDVATLYAELAPIQASLAYYDGHVLPLLDRSQAEITSDRENKVISANQITSILQELVKMRVEHLNLRYRHNQRRVRLELYLGTRLADLETSGTGPAPAPSGAAQGRS